jgi:hypothetical protein
LDYFGYFKLFHPLFLFQPLYFHLFVSVRKISNGLISRIFLPHLRQWLIALKRLHCNTLVMTYLWLFCLVILVILNYFILYFFSTTLFSPNYLLRKISSIRFKIFLPHWNNDSFSTKQLHCNTLVMTYHDLFCLVILLVLNCFILYFFSNTLFIHIYCVKYLIWVNFKIFYSFGTTIALKRLHLQYPCYDLDIFCLVILVILNYFVNYFFSTTLFSYYSYLLRKISNIRLFQNILPHLEPNDHLAKTTTLQYPCYDLSWLFFVLVI